MAYVPMIVKYSLILYLVSSFSYYYIIIIKQKSFFVHEFIIMPSYKIYAFDK